MPLSRYCAWSHLILIRILTVRYSWPYFVLKKLRFRLVNGHCSVSAKRYIWNCIWFISKSIIFPVCHKDIGIQMNYSSISLKSLKLLFSFFLFFGKINYKLKNSFSPTTFHFFKIFLKKSQHLEALVMSYKGILRA